MSDRSAIEWTDASWNPIVGCSILSPGCTNCYAMKRAARIHGKSRARYSSTRWATVHVFPRGPHFGTSMRRVGKKAAGCLLDGREWNEFPQTSSKAEAAA